MNSSDLIQHLSLVNQVSDLVNKTLASTDRSIGV